MCVYEALMKKIKELRLQVYPEKTEKQNQDPNYMNNQQRLDELRNFNLYIHIPDSKFRFNKVDFSNFFSNKDCFSAILACNLIWIQNRNRPSPLILLAIRTIDDIVYEDSIPRATILRNINNLFELLELRVVNILSRHRIRIEYFWKI